MGLPPASAMVIRPHQGVDAITFGGTRSAVAQLFSVAPRRFRRNAFAVSDEDFFAELGFFVEYDAGDRCVAVHFTHEVRVKYEGFDLFARTAREPLAWARAQDQDLDDRDGFISRALGLSMYAPAIDENDEASEAAESFMVFQPGYYDRPAARP